MARATTKKARYALFLSTAGSLQEARKISEVLLQQQLVACVNIVPTIESHYWWEGNLCNSNECLLLIKSDQRHRQAIEELIKQNHSYTTPEFIQLDITAGSQQYLDWITATTQK